jgi:hypothetical protein
MDFGLSFSYVFKDKKWFEKIILPALCGLIPVIGQFVVAGWGFQATKNVIDGKVEDALPRLSFGADLGRGFMAAVITAIYSIPVAIVVAMAGGLFAGAGAATEDALSIILVIVGGCVGILALLLAIFIVFMGMAAVANYIAKGEFGAAFRFGEVFDLLKKSFVSWLIVFLGQILAIGIIAPLGVIVCGIGALLTSAYGIAIFSHLLGQAYNESTKPVLGEVEVL